MKNWIQSSLPFAALLVLGCGYSPLLRHTVAGEAGLFNQENLAECTFRFTTQNLCAAFTEHSTTNSDGETDTEYHLRFWDPSTGDSVNGPFIDPQGTVAMKLWMASMNHGSTRVTVSPLLNDVGTRQVGYFLAKPIHFVMGGPWEIWVQLKNGSQVTDQAKIDIVVGH